MLKIRLEFLQLLLCGIIISILVGCDSPNSQKRTDETLVFNVDQTRLEPAITDTTLKLEISAPKGWKAIEDAMLMEVIDKLGDTLTQGLQMTPRWIFLNENSQAMCVVSRLEGGTVPPNDTLLKTLETTYRTQFPKATVQRAIFLKDAFRVHQLMVGAPDFVLIKLICNAPENPAFEVDYVVPKDVYKTELRAIESSIGSITLITNSP
jgi:hypothetical protein